MLAGPEHQNTGDTSDLVHLVGDGREVEINCLSIRNQKSILPYRPMLCSTVVRILRRRGLDMGMGRELWGGHGNRCSRVLFLTQAACL